MSRSITFPRIYHLKGKVIGCQILKINKERSQVDEENFSYFWGCDSEFFVFQGQTHVVKKNETLGGIAQKYGVSVGSLQALNGITNPNLLCWKKLKIPPSGISEITYTVKKGDIG